MSIKQYYYLNGVVLSCFALLLLNCGKSRENSGSSSFTKADSLTETYLALQDSILQAWNQMVDDDNRKIKAMHNLVHDLMVAGNNTNENLISLEQRLEQLNTLKYDQKTMANPELVDEYDFATSSLISEIISVAESSSKSSNNRDLQNLIDSINSADQRVNTYREEYDYIINKYNRFIEENKNYLKEIDPKYSLQKKPIFQMTEVE